jgi:SOS response regulatory protein OraA/RecX
VQGKILSIRTKEKKSALVILEIATECGAFKYTLSEGTYRDIGCPLSGEIIDDEKLSAVIEEDERRRCLQKALKILSFADNSEQGLYMKLLKSGFAKECSKECVKECVGLGYINEGRQIEASILRAAEEGFGPYKILRKLLSRGYKKELCFLTLRGLEVSGEINYAKMREKLLKEKLPEDASADVKHKLLHKYGYTK